MTTLPGYDKFFFGNAGIIKKYKQESDERTGMRPLRVFKNWIMDQVETGEQHSYDASKHPIVIMNFGTNITLYVADPDVLQDLYVTKNSFFDKTGHLAKVWKGILGHSFLFSRADAVWKAKRKACAHAFYKERMIYLLDVLKMKIGDWCEQWMTACQESPDGSTTIDLSQVFEQIFTRNMIHISTGQELSKE